MKDAKTRRPQPQREELDWNRTERLEMRLVEACPTRRPATPESVRVVLPPAARRTLH